MHVEAAFGQPKRDDVLHTQQLRGACHMFLIRNGFSVSSFITCPKAMLLESEARPTARMPSVADCTCICVN